MGAPDGKWGFRDVTRFALLSEIENVETIARGREIRELGRLCARYGGRNWRKRKGSALVRLADGSLSRAEIHWYEAHGIGRRQLKIKRLLSDER